MRKLQCPSCKIELFGKKFYKHILEKHDITHEKLPQLYVQLYLNNHWPTCQCGCNKPLIFKSWIEGFGTTKFLRGHNAIIDSSFNRPEIIAAATKKRLEGYETGRISAWNNGKTKETDERIAAAALKISLTNQIKGANGELTKWRKDEPIRAAFVNTKQSVTKKRKFKSGEIKSWNFGQTKETHSSLAAVAIKNSKHAKQRFKLSEEEFFKRINAQDKFEFRDEYKNYTTRRVGRLKFSCKVCQTVQLKSLAMLEETPICFTCHPKESMGQLAMLGYVQSLTSNILSSDRKLIAPYEIDILIPGKLGIEYHGVYWHSEKFHDETSCDNKLSFCLEKQLPLLQVFEDEWYKKQDIVKSLIKARLGLINNRLFARKCKLLILTAQQRRDFFNQNHLEGDVGSKICFGLVQNNEIVAALSLRKPFHKKYEHKLEVARFSVKINTIVVGALSRLTTAAKIWSKNQSYQALITYVDRRVGEGNGYKKSGWRLIKQTSPRFWWLLGAERLNRFAIRANKSKGLSENDVAAELGAIRIYGTSNNLFEIKL